MKKILLNSFTIALILFVIFRILLYFFGSVEDGNFLILTVIPILFFSAVVIIVKAVYRYLKS